MSSNKDFLVVSAISYPEPGGPSKYLDFLIKSLGLDAYTFNFENVTQSKLVYVKQSKLYKIRKLVCCNSKISYFLRIFLMSYFLSKSPYKKLLALDVGVGGLSSFLSRKPYVVRFVGSWTYETHYSKKIYAKTLEDFFESMPFIRRIQFFVEKRILYRSRKIYVPSFYLKNILMNYYNIPYYKIFVIENFYDSWEKLETKCSKNNAFIFVGRIIALKQPHYVLKLAIRYPFNDFYFVGEGHLLDVMKKLATKYNIKNVMFLGALSKNDVLQYMAKSKALIHPTLYEGQSFTLLEACSLSLCVITTPLDANKELLGNRGFYAFDYNEFIKAVEKVQHKKCICSLPNINKYDKKRHIRLLQKYILIP